MSPECNVILVSKYTAFKAHLKNELFSATYDTV